jgi:hypothetical protein
VPEWAVVGRGSQSAASTGSGGGGHRSARVRARCDSALKPARTPSCLWPAATTLTASSVRDRVLTGIVIDFAHRGRGYDHVIACEAGTLSAVFGTGAHPRGSTVHVALDPKRTVAHVKGDHDALRPR